VLPGLVQRTMKSFRHSSLLSALAILLFQVAFAASRPPNVVFILADDLGWSDLGCYGGDLHETPNLDRLAREGVRFTQSYAMPVCSPTRASILTGRHAARLHYTILPHHNSSQRHPLRGLEVAGILPVAV